MLGIPENMAKRDQPKRQEPDYLYKRKALDQNFNMLNKSSEDLAKMQNLLQ